MVSYLFHDLHLFLNSVEMSGAWPSATLEGNVALGPKDETLVNPSAMSVNP